MVERSPLAAGTGLSSAGEVTRGPDLAAAPDGALPPSEPPYRRLQQLDALRSFAILAVLVEHWGGKIRDVVPIGAGTLGVSLFFTLSGFLITGVLLKDLGSRSRRQVLGGFYIRRFFRLLPAFYATIAISALLDIDAMRSSWYWHLAYLSNFYMASGGAETVFWSLAVEEQFYLFWPLLLLLTPRRWWLAIALAMIVLAPVTKAAFLLAGSHLSFYMLPWQFEYLGAGCAIALLCFRDGRPNRFEWISDRDLNRIGILALSCFLLAAADWFVHGIGVSRILFMNLLCASFFAWLVLRTAKGWTGLLAGIFDFRPLQYIGVISYGIYLVHNWMPDFVRTIFGPLPKTVAGPIVAVLTFALCALSWRFFERPLIALGKRISDAVEGPRPAVQG